MAASENDSRDGIMSVSSTSCVASPSSKSDSDESRTRSSKVQTSTKDEDCFLPQTDISQATSDQKSISVNTTSGRHFTSRSSLVETDSWSGSSDSPNTYKTASTPLQGIPTSSGCEGSSIANRSFVFHPGKSNENEYAQKYVQGSSSSSSSTKASRSANYTPQTIQRSLDTSRNLSSTTPLSTTNLKAVDLGTSTSSGCERSSFANRSSTFLPGKSNEKEYAQKYVKGSSSSSAPDKVSRRANYTPKTIQYSVDSSRTLSSTTPLSTTSLKVVAIVEGRGNARGEIGMAYIDLHNSVLVLSQFADTQAYLHLAVQLDILNPIEVIFPHTVMQARSKIISRIREIFPEILTVTVLRKYFNETKGLQSIQDLCAPEYKTVEVEVSSKYYCLSACAALIKYVEFKQSMTYASQSLKIVYRTTADATLISTSTARHLELVTNNLSKIEHTLYGILNYTQTPGGDRLLRANILQPPCDTSTINTRLDCVSELMEYEDLFNDLKSVIGKFMDTEHLLSLFTQVPKEKSVRSSEYKITNVICLKHALDLVNPLHTVLGKAKNVLFQTYCEALSDERFRDLQEKLSGVIHSDARWQKGTLNMHMQKCFAIKPNINGLLDIARRAYTESVNDVNDVVKQLEKQHNIAMNVAYTSTRGFFIKIQSKTLLTTEQLPPIFLKVNNTRNTITCTTEDLIKLNDRIRESLNEIYITSELIIDEVLKEIREYMGCLYNLTEAVSSIDFLLSLAHACTLSDHVKPEFSDITAIKGGRHPIVEKIMGPSFVPNDTFLCDHQNFIILSGANMSGKTTYLKQVAILQIMAQMGCYVPAEFASLRIADQILTRMGSSSDIEKNLSTFTMQMKEASFILQHATAKSLIIMDELGNGTNGLEGCGIAYAICEELLTKEAFTICSTHFEPLKQLSSAYTNVENYHFKVHYNLNGEDGAVCNFSHMLILGACNEKNYGIKMAELSDLPPSVLQEAKEMAENLSETEKNENKNVLIVAEDREKIKLAIHLIHVADMEFSDESELRNHLKEIKRLFLLANSCSEHSQSS